MDDFNREALAIGIDLNIPAQRVVRVLDRIVENSAEDADGQWTRISLTCSGAVGREEHGVMLEFIKPGKPTQNALMAEKREISKNA